MRIKVFLPSTLHLNSVMLGKTGINDHPFLHLHLWPGSGRAILAFPRYNDFIKHGTHQTWDEKHMLAFNGHFVLFPLFHYETFRWAFLCKVSSGKRENSPIYTEDYLVVSTTITSERLLSSQCKHGEIVRLLSSRARLSSRRYSRQNVSSDGHLRYLRKWSDQCKFGRLL